MKHKSILFLISAIFSLTTFISIHSYAEEIQLIASVDKVVLTTNDSLNLTIKIKGSANTPQPNLPNLNAFNMIFGPSVSTQTSIINGRVSVSKGFSYVLKPKSSGNFTIDSFVLQYQGKIYRSNTITVDVIDKGTGNPNQPKQDARDITLDQKIFVEFTTDKQEAYTYEQVILTFKFFYQRGLPISDVEYVEPKIRNFIKEDMGQQRNYEVVRNGMIFNVIELKTALFPVVSGNLQINSAKLKCNIVVKTNNSQRRNTFGDSFFDDFFGGNQTKYPLERGAEPIILSIKELPTEGKPDDFNGAVGIYDMECDMLPLKLSIGDPITLTMKVKGIGNLQTVSEPSLTRFNANDFKIYPSETTTKIIAKTKNIKGHRIFRKVIEPQEVNIKQTPAISFSFFNPDLEKYVTVTQDPFAIEVEASESEMPLRLYVRDIEANKDKVSIITKDILPIMTNTSNFSNQKTLLYKSPITYAILIVPFIIVLASIVTQQRSKKLKTDVSYARKRRAQSDAKKRLSEATRAMKEGSAQEFYSTLSVTIAEYIANKLNTTTATIAPNTIATLLGGKNISDETINKIIKLLELCDFGRFAKAAATKDTIQNALNTAEELITDLGKELK